MASSKKKSDDGKPNRDPSKKLAHNHLAEGEVTGHFHAAVGEGVELYDGDTAGSMLMDAPHGAAVTHQEHNAFSVPAGSFVRRIVQEMDHEAEAVRNVAD